MSIDRRSLLASGALLPLIGLRLAPAAGQAAQETADYILRIATGMAELAPKHIVSTTLYNGQFPGPLLRFKEGERAVVDVYNDTDTPELVHWHGQIIPSDVDGAGEEGTPYVPPHGMRRISFVPSPPASGSTTRMSWLAATSIAAPIPAWSGRSTSSRRTNPEPTTARCF